VGGVLESGDRLQSSGFGLQASGRESIPLTPFAKGEWGGRAPFFWILTSGFRIPVS